MCWHPIAGLAFPLYLADCLTGNNCMEVCGNAAWSVLRYRLGAALRVQPCPQSGFSVSRRGGKNTVSHTAAGKPTNVEK